MGAALACAKAERDNSTVARLSTTRYCKDCKPARRPLCTGRTCRGKADPQRTQPANCCSVTKNGKRLHCARCCRANQERKLQREKSAKASQMGQASGIARRKQVSERRQQVRQLLRAGTDEIEMTQLLGVSLKTLRTDIQHIRKATKAATAANTAAWQQRRQTIAQLHAQGAVPDDIAARVGVTTTTVKRHLKDLRTTPTAATERRESSSPATTTATEDPKHHKSSRKNATEHL